MPLENKCVVGLDKDTLICATRCETFYKSVIIINNLPLNILAPFLAKRTERLYIDPH